LCFYFGGGFTRRKLNGRLDNGKGKKLREKENTGITFNAPGKLNGEEKKKTFRIIFQGGSWYNLVLNGLPDVYGGGGPKKGKRVTKRLKLLG